jgi:V/A-type H+-transporting ATPase subunit C
MAVNDFVESSGYMRVLEKRILTSDGLDRLLDAPSAADALKVLSQNSVYDFSALQTTEEYEQVIEDSLVSMYNEMYIIADGSKIMDIPAAKYDYHNIKVAVKAKYLKGEYNHLLMGVTKLSPASVYDYVTKGTGAEELPEHIRLTADEAAEIFESTNNPQDVDVFIDKMMYAYMLSVCKQLNLEMATDYVQKSIDYFNLKTFLRIKDMLKGRRFLQNSLIPGGFIPESMYLENYDKTPEDFSVMLYYRHFGTLVKAAVESYEQSGNFSDLERRLDDALTEHLRASKYLAFGAELILSYIYARENEMRQIRIILSGKINSVRGEILKERLRENYA